jgi:hypothetical protein
MVSISCPSETNLLNFFDTIKEKTKCKVKIVIKIRIIIAWSWKNKICSIEGETESWKDKEDHFGI